MTTYKSYNTAPFAFINGLGISNNATTPNTKLDIAAGSTLDSTGTFQLTSTATITINAANSGLNGLDTGTFAASKVYAVFLVADPVTLQPIGAMLSLSYTAPLMPFGYSAFALLGFATTDSSVHFLKGYWTDTDSTTRIFMYDAPIACLTGGVATTYGTGGIALTAFVPAINNLPVYINADLIPGNAAGDTLKFQPGNGTGDAITITGQVTTVHITPQVLVLSQLVTGVPTINYKVTNAGDTAAAAVGGYIFTL